MRATREEPSMHRTRLRALLAGAMSASLCLLLLLPGVALGGAVSRERDRGVFIFCVIRAQRNGKRARA